MNDEFLSFIKTYKLRLSVSCEKDWWAVIESQKEGFIYGINSDANLEKAIQKSWNDAYDKVTITPSKLILMVQQFITHDNDGYFMMRTNKEVDFGYLTLKELKNYAEWDRHFWSYYKDGFIFHCGPPLYKEHDSNIYHNITKVFKAI